MENKRLIIVQRRKNFSQMSLLFHSRSFRAHLSLRVQNVGDKPGCVEWMADGAMYS